MRQLMLFIVSSKKRKRTGGGGGEKEENKTKEKGGWLGTKKVGKTRMRMDRRETNEKWERLNREKRTDGKRVKKMLKNQGKTGG